MGLAAIVPGLGFLYFYFSGTRKTGPETFGKPIWWNTLRPIHGILYLIFAYMAINKNHDAWIVLLIDAIIGVIASLIFYGSFAKFAI
tara:strand:+ start:1464 stop:1724 length:261 start_codon:yes stop_codon:yes gene_type:complete